MISHLRRWRDHGGTCSTSAPDRDGRVVISLLRCDGGEEADRLTTDDPDVLDWLAGVERDAWLDT